MIRRDFLLASSAGALSSFLVPGIAEAEVQESESVASGLVTGTPKPLRHKEIPGFLSAAQIAPHHSAHYGGALKAFVGVEKKLDDHYTAGTAIDPAAFERMKQIQSSRGNSVILHELYFDGLALQGADPSGRLKDALVKRFGSVERWASDFVASAMAAAGWAMLTVHPVNGRLYNVVSDEHAQGSLWMAAPLVLIDTYEHAFYVDYQNRKAEYVDRFLRFVDWDAADRRYRAALPGR